MYLELRGCFIIHVILEAGNNQIEAGIYSFSRGCLMDGIASSGSILDFLTLNETSFERSATPFTWVQTWIVVNNI